MKQSITRKSDLTVRQRRLVERMQRLRFGCIEHLLIRDGEPVFNPALTRCLRKIRIKGSNRPHPASSRPDTVLKAEAVELFAHFREISHGLVRSLTVHDGLPADLVIEEEPGDCSGSAMPSALPPGGPPLADVAVDEMKCGR